MTKNNDDIDVYDLLDRADELIDELDSALPQRTEKPAEAPQVSDATIIFQPITTHEEHPAHQAVSSIHAYNGDFQGRQWFRTEDAPPQAPPVPASDPTPQTPKKKKARKRGRGCLTSLLIFLCLIGLAVGALAAYIRPPQTDQPIGARKSGVSAILLCGADEGAERTDTMMLLYVDANKKQAGLLTLPRDTYTQTAYGMDVKLNSAYGRNGGGEEGMEVLLDYVQRIIGYRPDGYMLVELPLLRDLVDLMGGVDFDVPQDFTFEGLGVGHNISLPAGMQHLNGEQAMGLLRFRYGYYNQDLGRQDVQKDFLKACMDQWVSLDNLGKIPDAMALFREQGMTDLTTANFLWFGWNLMRCGFSNLRTETLPGYATMIGDQSFYVLYPYEVADMIQDRYNPYKAEITREDLEIVTE